MISGVGIDHVEVSRVAALVERHRNLSSLFGPAELEQLRGMGRMESYAASFCAKEAFGKALGIGLQGFRLCEVEVLREPSGRPFLRLSGRAAQLARARGLAFFLSLSHSAGIAAAVVVAEISDAL